MAAAQATASATLANSTSAIAHELDDAAVLLGNPDIDKLLAVRLERSERARLILFHEAAVANHIGGQDGGEAALHVQPP